MTDRAGEAELLAQVYAAPDDDTPRLVYADWLLERDDPHGEFIALQIERARSKARKGGRKREAELLSEHVATWAAPLESNMILGANGQPAIPIVEFRRGFPAAVRTETINCHVAWSTVTHCNVAPHDDGCQLGALRSITEAKIADILALSKLTRPLALQTLIWGLPHDAKYSLGAISTHAITPEAIAAFSKITVLPALRRIELAPMVVGPTPTPAQLAWLWSGPATGALQELLVPGHSLGAWLAALATTSVQRFELVLSGNLAYGWDSMAHIVAERRDGWSVTVQITRATVAVLGQLAASFGELDRGVVRHARIAITSKAEWHKSEAERAALTAMLEERAIAPTIEQASR
jgi:uncharacterized protein (TIGR02996 family)